MISLEKKTIMYTLVIILVYIIVRYYCYKDNTKYELKNRFLNTDISSSYTIGGKKNISALFSSLATLNSSTFQGSNSLLSNNIKNKINESQNDQINIQNKFNKLVDNMINEIIFDSKKKINDVSYDIVYKTSKF